MTPTEFFASRLIGPFFVGFVLFYLIHWLTGVLVTFVVKDDGEKMADAQAAYIEAAMMFKDILALWALGMITLMASGWIK